MSLRRRPRAGFILGLAALGGCTLAPFYRRPAPPVARAWPGEASAPSAPRTAAADIGWRDFFKDPRLQALIEEALAQNRDLRVAALDVEAARERYGIQRSAFLPGLQATGQENAQRFAPNVAFPNTPTFTTREYEAGLGFTAYEIDFFGRLRSLSRGALENYFGTEEARRSAQIALVSEVASRYLARLADQESLTLARGTFASQDDSLRLTRMRFEAGVATEIDVSQAETSAETARADVARYARLTQQDENALTLLAGAPLPAASAEAPDFDAERLLAGLPEGLPSDLLERRPDILAAEHTLRAANADIGAARAAFFPSILLTGTYGTASTQLSGLFQAGTQVWTFNPSINLPIFTAATNWASLKLAHVDKRIAIARYEKSIQTAFREVADALAGVRTFDEQVAAQAALVASNDHAYQLSLMRFRGGIDNYLTVIVSQRALYSAQQDLIAVKLQKLQNMVALYTALGGGWRETSAGPVPQAEAGPAPPATSTTTAVAPPR
ncbi:MAG TPA: efflux transporter outer membrane subunit [Elusimicrobiota bacterium]|jgi:multidrug efflux system outer membrane protein|nr:efflux transporter outer membrane subunit [Elusimicrobiota bacterium]